MSYIRKKQNEFTRILLEVDHICRENGIEYWLDFGTLLGCLRHEGFIPWDDDCDISMTRKNFEKFLKVYKNYYNGERLVQCFETNPDYPTVFARYMDMNTAEITGNRAWDMGPSGICMDLFFTIPVPPKEPERSKMLKWFLVYDEYVNNIYRHLGHKPDDFSRPYAICRFIGKIVGEKKVIRWLEKRVYCCSDEECEDYVQSSGGKAWPALYPKDWITPTVDKMNDGVMLQVPNKYLELLRREYSDGWRYLPSEQVENSYISNLHLPSSIYEQDYLRFLDMPKVLARRKKRKILLTGKDMSRRKKQLQAVNKLQIAKVEALFAKEERDVTALLKERRYEELDKIFAPFYEVQLNQELKRWPGQLVSIRDDFACAAVMTLIEYRNQYYKAMTLFDLWEKGGKKLSAPLKELKKLVHNISDMNMAIDYGRWDEARKMAEDGLSKYPELRDYKLGLLRVDINDANEPAALEQLKERAKELCGQYAEDGEIEKCLGDVYWKLEDHDEALNIYSKCMEHTLNGLVMLDIEKKRSTLQK